jgi:TusA-related sulfurtransferase
MAQEQMKNLSADETPPFDETLNIRGEVCPYTFVRSKLKLEDMDEGQVLRVIVDYPPAIKNVPQSAANEGNEVLGIKQIEERAWEIYIRKREKKK